MKETGRRGTAWQDEPGLSDFPVFDCNTHRLVGIVIHGYNTDFRWTGKCWTSIIYPNIEFGSKGARCTKASEFLSDLDKLVSKFGR